MPNGSVLCNGTFGPMMETGQMLENVDLDDLVARISTMTATKVVAELGPCFAGGHAADDEALLNEQEVAALLGVKPSTLASWRCRGGGPPFLRVGQGRTKPAVRYKKQDVVNWADSRRHINTACRVEASGASDE
jgi:hypothetical protein